MCPEDKECRYWYIPENGTELQCMKPRHLFCPDGPEQDEEEDDDGVRDLNF
jgi:hypothetical protein